MIMSILGFLAGPKERLPTFKERVSFLANLSLTPILICYVAFTRSFIYRFISTPDKYSGVDMKCSRFGWLNNATVKVTCNHRPLDIHATLALMWLALYTIQTLAIKFNFRKVHTFVGKYIGVVAVINIGGMLLMTVYDKIHPMEDSDRPASFRPLMFMTAVFVAGCAYMSFKGLQATPRDLDEHILWIVRAFITSFSTPIIRFYPIVLRHIFSTECVQQKASLETWVIGSTAVSCACCLYLFWLSNKACLKDPMDLFFKAFLVFAVFILVIDVHSTVTKGFFFWNMYTCYRDGVSGVGDEL
jgi:hypothetical protein